MPRRRYASYVAAAFATAVVVMLAVPAAGTTASASALYQTLKQAPRAALAIAVFHLVAPLAIAWLGGRIIRGRPLPSTSIGLAAIVALLPAIASLIATGYGFRALGIAAALYPGTPTIGSNLVAQGAGELTELCSYGVLVTAACGLVAVVSAFGAVAAIDVARIDPALGKQGGRWAMSVVASGAGWLVTLAWLALPVREHRPLTALTLLPACFISVAVVLAAFAARSSPALQAWHDALEARRHLGMLVVAAAFGILLPCFLERVALGRFETDVLAAISEAPMDAAARLRAHASLPVAERFVGRAYLVHFVFGSVTFGLVIAPALRRFTQPFSAGAAAVLTAFAFLFAAGKFAKIEQRTMLESVTKMWRISLPSDLTLPTSYGMSRSTAGQGSLTIDRAGKARTTYIAVAYPPERLTLYLDASLTVEQLLVALPPAALEERELHMQNPNPMGHPGRTLFTLVTRPLPQGGGAGDYGPLLGEEVRYRSFVMPSSGRKKWPECEGSVITARILDGRRLEIDRGADRPLRAVGLGPDESIGDILPRYGETIAGVRLVASPTETFATIAAALSTLSVAYGDNLSSTYDGGGIGLFTTPGLPDRASE